MIRWVNGLIFIPTLACADWQDQDQYPLLGDVVNVASDDALNIRLAPDHQSEILGVLAHDATKIEVVAEDDSGHWGLVNSGEGSGWIRLHFLEISEQPKWHAFQTPLSCFGTEPFWDFEVNVRATQARFRDLDMTATEYDVTWISGIAARPGGVVGLGAGDLAQGFSALIENQICHDGMSDRTNALRLRLFILQDGEAYGLDGCCGLAP